ncbi:MAG: DMT family transporter [Okeania sp. SIO2D1]|nr:DMT family transporter [Okeania sp. SIO2D1]
MTILQNKTHSQGFQLALPSLLIGVFILSFAAIFTRISENELGPAGTMFNRYLIAFTCLCLWDRIQSLGIGGLVKPQENIGVKDWFGFILSSIVGTLTIFLWAWSLTQSSVANSNLLHNLTPIFTTLGGWLFLSQSFNPKFLLGMGLALVGAITIGWGDFQADTRSLFGDALALLSAVFYAANYLIRENLRSKFSATTILFWPCLFCGCFSLCLTLITENQIFPSTWQTWLAIIALGILCQLLGQWLLIHNLKHFSSSFVTLLMLLEPLLTAIFAWFIFSEPLTPLNWIAFFLVLAGIYLTKQSKGAEKI